MQEYEKTSIFSETLRHMFGLWVRNGCNDVTHKPVNGILFALCLLLWGLLCYQLVHITYKALSVLCIFALIFATPLFVAFVLAAIGKPHRFFRLRNQLHRAGLTNSVGEVPMLLSVRRSEENPKIIILSFFTNGVGLHKWEERRPEIQAATNLHIDTIKEGNDFTLIEVHASKDGLPDLIEWDDKYLPDSPSVLALGMGLAKPLTVDLDVNPHMLLAGATGAGKSFLQQNLIHQCLLHDHWVYIIDAKGGLDYSEFQASCRILTEPDEILAFLKSVLGNLHERKTECARLGVENVRKYNLHQGCTAFSRMVIVVDELAEVLLKGNTKESKARAVEIENALSTIARLGRAFEINLILGTQRPDATIISGQIRNNCDTRICGRCSQNLALVIHDNAQAAELIPSDARGRFLTQDGQLFQGFAPPESEG